jgi:hypothetical protein
VNIDHGDTSLARVGAGGPAAGHFALTRDLEGGVYPNRPAAANHENKGD